MSAAASKQSLESSPSPATNNNDTNIQDDVGTDTPDNLKTLSAISPPGTTGPVIAIDLDDVLSQTNRSVCDWHNEVYGTEMSLSNFYYYYYWKNPYWGPIQTTFEKVRDYYATRRIFEARPVDGAREGIQALRDMGFRLIIVTARSQDVHEDSWHWVDKWFPGLFDSVVCTGQFTESKEKDKGHEVTTKLSKAQVCADLKARLLIDDSSENALQVSTAPVRPTPVLLFGDYQWNSRLSSSADAVDAMVFDTRLLIEGGREFWKEERLEDHIPEGAPLHRVKDWAAVIRWVKQAREEGRL
ncbi:hypothetical protein PQX77_014230 [Marasmius sp. AFHP31]|nr:hypothetical protein PQX77_014230 [Marasmius sp. AFHP31]